MKKYILIIIIVLLLSLFIKVPSYRELNDLKIIKSIDCDKDYYYLEEVIPIKDDNGIKYAKNKCINKKD